MGVLQGGSPASLREPLEQNIRRSIIKESVRMENQICGHGGIVPENLDVRERLEELAECTGSCTSTYTNGNQPLTPYNAVCIRAVENLTSLTAKNAHGTGRNR